MEHDRNLNRSGPGADLPAVACGRRCVSGLAFYATWCLTALTNPLYRSRLTDMETCYKVMSADVARSLALESTRFEIEAEMTAKLLKNGHRINELPIRIEPRSRSQGKKIGWRDGVQAVRVLCRYRFKS
jgi:dolichol-phosphate mannosyltransferase